MATALDVAKFFLSKVDRENGDAITQLKLQKLVYYAQAWSAALRNEPIFPEVIQAWINGPVVPEVWAKYREYERTPIPFDEEIDLNLFTSGEIALLEEVWNTYGELSASKLWQLSHQEYPWKASRAGVAPDEKTKEEIPFINLVSYYSSLTDKLHLESKIIPPEALQPNKQFLVSFFLKDGNAVKVPCDSIEDFIIDNSDSLEREYIALGI